MDAAAWKHETMKTEHTPGPWIDPDAKENHWGPALLVTLPPEHIPTSPRSTTGLPKSFLPGN